MALSQEPISEKEEWAVPFESVRLAGELINLVHVNRCYGPAFCGKLLDEFTLKWIDGPATSNSKRAAALRRWLVDLHHRAELPSAAEPLRSVRRKLASCEFSAITRDEFDHTLQDFLSRANEPNDRSIFSTSHPATRRPVIEALSAALRDLADPMGWPKLDPLKCNFSITRGTTPSLGELTFPDGKGDHLSTSSAGLFGRTLARNRDRQRRLRSICEDDLLRCYEAFQYGQRLLGRTDLASATNLLRAERDLDGITVLKGRKSELPGVAEACFPGDDVELQLANLLKHIVVNLDGKVSGRSDWATEGIRCLVTNHGGVRRVVALLEAGPRALVAAYTIVLIESGFNAQSCNDLAANPFAGNASAGRVDLHVLTSTKSRPLAKPVKCLLGEGQVYLNAMGFKISSKRAIDIWLEMSAPIRRRAINESEARLLSTSLGDDSETRARSERLGGSRVQDWLWIMPTGQNSAGEIRKASAGNFRDWWTDMLADHSDDPIIGGLPIRRKHLRPTFVQLKAIDRNGDVELAALAANHSSAATTFQNYLSRPYIHARLEDQIRAFQDRLQVAVISDVSGKAAKLAMTDLEFDQLRESALDCGLAFYGQVDDALKSGTSAGELTPIAYSDSEGAMSSAALLRLSLDMSQEEFSNKNPRRWARIWLPLHALSIAVWNILSDGPRASRFKKIATEVAQGIATGEIEPFRAY